MIKVVAAIIYRDEKVLIARRAPHKSMPGKWEFPGGKVETGETQEQALIRELKEEFGVKSSIKKWFERSIMDYGKVKIILDAFIVVCREDIISSTDHDQIVWIPIPRLSEIDFLAADIPIARKIQTDLK